MELLLDLLQSDLETVKKVQPQSEYSRGMAEGLRRAIEYVSDQIALLAKRELATSPTSHLYRLTDPE